MDHLDNQTRAIARYVFLKGAKIEPESEGLIFSDAYVGLDKRVAKRECIKGSKYTAEISDLEEDRVSKSQTET